MKSLEFRIRVQGCKGRGILVVLLCMLTHPLEARVHDLREGNFNFRRRLHVQDS